MAANWGPNALLCTQNRTKCILFVSVMSVGALIFGTYYCSLPNKWLILIIDSHLRPRISTATPPHLSIYLISGDGPPNPMSMAKPTHRPVLHNMDHLWHHHGSWKTARPGDGDTSVMFRTYVPLEPLTPPTTKCATLPLCTTARLYCHFVTPTTKLNY
jgi:hypothetical protein